MSTPKRRKGSKKHKFNLLLTESQYQQLRSYAEREEKDMAQIVRDLIRTLPTE
jgi:hypothetical protein